MKKLYSKPEASAIELENSTPLMTSPIESISSYDEDDTTTNGSGALSNKKQNTIWGD